MIYHEFAIGAETLPETIESGPLCITDLFQNKNSPKKTGFFPKKDTFYSTFKCGHYNVFKKKKNPS